MKNYTTVVNLYLLSGVARTADGIFQLLVIFVQI